ncbi:MAG: ribulose-phosphate 3-epimerase [Flavobacteriaceae bacterium]|nr:ribulose-phosphate 3-epimerase [Flavobacteriaceae bacterium]|tara:strand:- start:1607 stop:2254 length:648 start_codon:yes stop_codon:yes gene_type:complete
MSIKVSPSILAADFGNIERECNLIDKSGADWFHLDVMDGIFVPNISFGIPVVKAIRKMTSKPLDVHLMITEPERYIDKFIEIGSDIISFHIEATNKLEENISLIKSKNVKVGIAINPDTPIDSLIDIINKIDLVCLMGVFPGFAGQKFIKNTFDRLKELKKLIIDNNSKALIEVDGGVKADNYMELRSLGADVLVAGSYIFKSKDYKKVVKKLKE